jgi:NAD(P)-dependent dehydrogenase (short-subunit alcohol dehydrogenase family)
MTALSGTILLTGANGGLGTAIVDAIVSRPELSGCHGLYAVRDADNATALQCALQAGQSHPHDMLSLDLSDLESVRQFAEAVNAQVIAGKIPRIRALILNAAYRERQGQTRTESGLDIAFATNYLGHWLLVLLLLQSMDHERGRIVVVGSWVHE